MNKALFPFITAISLILFLPVACAEQDQDIEAAVQTETSSQETPTSDTTGEAVAEADSLMDQPVDFSSPEKVEETLQNIREQEGDKAYSQVETAMNFLLFYDIGLAGKKERLYAKLNGRTPNQIIAAMKRK